MITKLQVHSLSFLSHLDGREQQWNFSAAIEMEKSRVQRKKRKFTITVVKKVPNMWQTLEGVQDSNTNDKMCSIEDTILPSSPEDEIADNGEESMTKEEGMSHYSQWWDRG